MSKAVKSPWDRIKDYFIFRPGAPGYVNYPRKTGEVTGGYRSPSPGSQKPAYIPFREKDDLFNTQYYTRDTKRNLLPPKPVPLRSNMIALPYFPNEGSGSKGRKNPAVERYDPTLTRSAMTTSWTAMRAELAKHQPDHLPRPWWFAKSETIENVRARAKANGHPEPIGVPKQNIGFARYENSW